MINWMQPRLSRHMKFIIIIARIRSKEWPEKTSSSMRFEPASLRSTVFQCKATPEACVLLAFQRPGKVAL